MTAAGHWGAAPPGEGQFRVRPFWLDSRFQVAVAHAVLAGLTVFLFWRAYHLREGLNDDQYITLAYAKNLAAGKGFVFNGGTPTLGTTAPLFTLVTAGLTWLFTGAGAAHVGVYFSAACLAVTVWLLLLFRARLLLGMGEAVLVALLWSTSRFANLGGEPTLFLMLLFVGILLAAARRPCWAGVVTGLLFLTRGEGALFGALLAAYAVCEHTRARAEGWPRALALQLVRLAAGFLLPVAAWSVYAWPRFGGILPDTLTAKMAQGRLPGVEHFPAGLWRAMLDEWGGLMTPWWPPARVLIWALVFLGAAVALRRAPWRQFLAWVALYSAAYTALAIPAYAYWYRIPVYWAWLALAGFGWAALWRLRPAGRSLRWGGRALALALLLVIASGTLVTEYLVSIKGAADPRAAAYRDLASWLRAHAQPGDDVAAMDVGYLGYFTEQPILDLGGLTRPDVMRLLPMQNHLGLLEIYGPAYYVSNSQPDTHTPPAVIRTATRAYDLAYTAAGQSSARETKTYAIYRRR
jgi:hypothetical protein